MRFRTRALALTGGVLLCLAAVEPAVADAQTRVAVRVAPRRTVVLGGYYYRPYYDPFYDPWFGFGYPGYRGYYGYQRRYYDMSAALRLQVKPRDTQVFLDGYYAGTVDDFDGVFQRLDVQPGDHTLDLYLPGHRSVQQKVFLQPGKTASVKLTMEPLAPGDPEPVRPSGGAPSGSAARDDRPIDASPRRPAPRGSRAGSSPDDRAVTRNDADYGSLAIRVQPGAASITIDGEKWEGPASDERLVLQLSAGRHVIEAQKDGYRRYTTEVTVRNGETATLNVSLTKAD